MLLLLLLTVAVLSTCESMDLLSQGISLTQSSDVICPGEELTLICQTNEAEIEILRWNVNFPSGDPTSIRKSIPIEGTFPPESFIHLTTHGPAVFNISRTSDNNTHPLVTELVIIGVNVGINGTEINCSRADLSNQRTIVIHVIDGTSDPATPNINEIKLEFNETNFTAILELTQPEDDVTYNASVFPFADLVPIESNTWQLIGSYNTSYNVSIVATLCEEYSTTTIVVLEYGTCELITNESLNFWNSGPTLRVNNTGSRNPATVGDSVSFYCLSGELMGQNKTTCQKSGYWEPDPSEVICSSGCDTPLRPLNGYVLTNISTMATFVCQNDTQSPSIIDATCTKDGVWDPNPRVYCTNIEVKGTNGVLVGGVLGAMFVATIIAIAVVLIFIILLRKGSISFKRPRSLVPEENMYRVSDQSQVENQNSIDQAETLVYADIGPASFKLRSQNNIILGPDEDDHVEYAQLNQNLLTVKLDETKQKIESSADNSLNLDTLLIQIKTAVTSRWYQLGEALEINKESLDRYSSHPPEDSIAEMLDQWLRSGPQRRTWKDVADALRRIGLQQLAVDIEKVYETGKLPIVVNMNDIPQDSLPPRLTELPPPLPSKMKPNSSDSNLISRHKRTLPPRTKQNSDSTLVNNQHGIHNRTLYTRDTSLLQLVQEITLAAPILDSDLMPPPLPPKHTAVSDACIDVAVPSRPPKN